MKKHYYLVLDVETANSTEDALVYDIGFAITDRMGNIYEAHSYINKDIFYYERQLMQTAYYSKKVPSYIKELKQGKRTALSLFEIRRIILQMFEKYDIKAVCAYNAHFDYTALNTTMRYETKSKYRYFLPYGTEIFDIWHMACQVICTQKKYYNFCIENDFVSKSNNIQTSAETVYKFLINDIDFEEEHKGLEDVLIEVEILKECYKKKKKMDRKINRCCWKIPQRKGK